MQGVNYSQKFRRKNRLSNLGNSITSQFMFPKYLMEYQNVKIVKSKFKTEKINKSKHKGNAVLKEDKKKRH